MKKIFVVTNQVGMIDRAFTSEKKAEKYCDEVNKKNNEKDDSEWFLRYYNCYLNQK